MWSPSSAYSARLYEEGLWSGPKNSSTPSETLAISESPDFAWIFLAKESYSIT